jgi:hypothetical protein
MSCYSILYAAAVAICVGIASAVLGWLPRFKAPFAMTVCAAVQAAGFRLPSSVVPLRSVSRAQRR